MKNICLLLGMLLAFQFASVAQTTQPGQTSAGISKQFRISWDKLSAARLAVDSDLGGASCDTNRMMVKLRAAKATVTCLKNANTPLELLMVIRNQCIQHPSCYYPENEAYSTPRAKVLIAEIEAAEAEWGRTLVTKKAYAELLAFASDQIQLKFVVDSIFDSQTLVKSKQPLASYTPEQIVILIEAADDVADDYGWSKPDLQAAVDKLKSTQIEFFTSIAEEIEEYSDLPEN